MPRKKSENTTKKDNPNVLGLKAEVLNQPITETLEQNYMPYAMSVIVSRAIPEIDGFKPSHRKLLYTMYKMNLLNGGRTKSANIVGQTMRLNPHGDSAIYETMVRLTKGNEALLVPFIDSKGNFGKTYSRDMAYAASRYTEAKLMPVCNEIFKDIDKDTVDFVDNYDSTTKEPTLLPTNFPNVLVASNSGIAVGMASQICSFNLSEVCDTTIAILGDENHDIMTTLSAPDFTTGGELIYDAKEIESIYKTGRGSFKVRAKWRYLKSENIIEIFEIPYTTTTEAIIDKVSELVKLTKIREISDMRDETDLSGLKLAIDLKRGTDPDKLMQKLFKMTSLQDSFSCNFNMLINGYPRVMGISEILTEWSAWRTECIKRRVFFDLNKKRDKLHLLNGLNKILLDIDKAITIIRETELEADVIPNLMIGFGIDEIQADYVAEIRLRNINREYILKRVEEISKLKEEIEDLEDLLQSKRRIKSVIISELKDVKKKYGTPRKTDIIYSDEIEEFAEIDEAEDYPVNLFLSNEGYFKKITPQSLRMSGEQKYKDGDGFKKSIEASNRDELLIFTDKQQLYKVKLSDFADSKASLLGTYLPSHLGFDEDENVFDIIVPGDYKKHLLLFYKNGKVARIEMSVYATKTNRKKLTGAYSDKSPLISVMVIDEEREIAMFSSDGRAVIFSSASLAPKATRSTQGVNVMTIKAKYQLSQVDFIENTKIVNHSRYRMKNIPAVGAILRDEDKGVEQLEIPI